MKTTKEQFLQRAKEYAISKGGECLAIEYITAKTKVQWKCSNAHHPIFEADFQIIYRKNWCTLCGIEKNANKASLFNGLDLAQAHALSKGGQCLSTEYKNAKTKMQWKCAEGHVWESNYDHIKRGRWCKQCGYNKALKKGFDQLAEQYAKLKNGYAILPTDRKVKTATIIKWKCSDPMHKEWEATYRNVVEKKGWCPYCAGKFSCEDYLIKAQEHALLNNCECLSETYIDQKTNMLWQCNDHGIWTGSYKNVVVRNLGCPDCRNILSPQQYLDNASKYAGSRGGKCISIQYISQNTKLTWECKKHGKWDSDYTNVVIHKRWCPECLKEEKNNKCLQRAKLYAKSLGGECLTTVFNSSQDLFTWKCHNLSHKQWQTKYNIVLGNKSWCPECGIYYQKENQVRKLLEYLLGFTLEKAKPDWNINPDTGNLLELDGYNEDKKIAFEYQGRQHYQDNVFSNSNQTLEYIQFKDKIKLEHCINNGITLIIIDGRKKLDTCKSMLKYLQKILDEYQLNYNVNIDLVAAEKIFNEARVQGWDSKHQIRLPLINMI